MTEQGVLWRRAVRAGAGILVALALTGYISATLGDADPKRAMWRTVLGGALGMAVTYGVGLLFNVNLA